MKSNRLNDYNDYNDYNDRFNYEMIMCYFAIPGW